MEGYRSESEQIAESNTINLLVETYGKLSPSNIFNHTLNVIMRKQLLLNWPINSKLFENKQDKYRTAVVVEK